jgi:preprotein translocase subunit SecE
MIILFCALAPLIVWGLASLTGAIMEKLGY